MSARASFDRYRWAAPIYDFATLAWSGGAIWRTRAQALSFAEPGRSFLVPGSGTGRLALEAAKRGARTVAIDRSPAMHARAERRLARHGLGWRRSSPAAKTPPPLQLRLGELDELLETEESGFDVVVAEHFLNVFTPEEMPKIRERLITLTRPGGVFVIADFSPVNKASRVWAQAAQRLHHVIPLGGCALLTRNAMHAIYDHGAELAGRSDLVMESSGGEQSFWIGPRWFQTWTFRKVEV